MKALIAPETLPHIPFEPSSGVFHAPVAHGLVFGSVRPNPSAVNHHVLELRKPRLLADRQAWANSPADSFSRRLRNSATVLNGGVFSPRALETLHTLNASGDFPGGTNSNTPGLR